MTRIIEYHCDTTPQTGWCEYIDNWGDWMAIAFPAYPGKQYYGRGPLQLSWNYNYGMFSRSMFGDEKIVLNSPELVATNGTIAFRAAIWFYMTPQNPKPSMHDIATGFWVPNTQDTNAGFQSGFGATINVLNGNVECGSTNVNANSRSSYYSSLMSYFGLSTAGE